MLRFQKTQLVSVLMVYLASSAVQARLFKDSSEQARSVFKHEGDDVIAFQIRLEKGAISLANPQFFSVSIDPRKLNTKNPESLYKAMTAWKELPLNYKDVDRDMVVHALNDSTEPKPIIINDNEFKLLLVEYRCRNISQLPRASLSLPPLDYRLISVVLTFDSTAIELFFEKCRSLKNVRSIEIDFPFVNFSNPQSGSRERELNPKNCQANSFFDSDVKTNRVRRQTGNGLPRRDDPPEGFSFTPTDRDMSILITSAMHSGSPGLLENGDWVAVMDVQGNCFGASEVNWDDGGIGIAAWGDDPSSQERDGFSDDEAIYFKIYDSSTQTTYGGLNDYGEVYVEFVGGGAPGRGYGLKYVTNDFAVAKIGTWPNSQLDGLFIAQWYLYPWYSLDDDGMNCNIMPAWYHIAQRTLIRR